MTAPAAPSSAPAAAAKARPSTWESLKLAFTSWRLGAVTLLSFSSGLPLGLVLTAIPFWMQQEGVDIKTIGLVTAAQAPYTFKFIWSPLMDRFAPKGARKRVWIAIGQLLLALSTFALALQAGEPTVAAVALFTLLISFASATQDIAVDAYAVEVLRKEEQGLAVGARIALYRAAMFVSGAFIVTLGPKVGWEKVYVALGVLYLALVALTFFAPEPEAPPAPPVSLRAAIWEPFVGFFRHSRALEIAGFLVLYKLADNLAGALVRPFLGAMGFDSVDVGVASGTVGLVATLVGTFLGGLLTHSMGLGRALWVFGFLQAISNLGYAAIAEVGMNRPLMYTAMAIETGTTGMGTGAFSVLLLRLTQRKFSATQYALFSSLFALSRTVSGPPAGAMVDAIGWRDFYLLTILLALPGLLMLQRFVPLGARDIPFAVDAEGADDAAAAPSHGAPVTRMGLVLRGFTGAVLGCIAGYLGNALLLALKLARGAQGTFDFGAAFVRMFRPERAVDAIDVFGPPAFGLAVGFAVAAYVAARRGVARGP